MGPRDSDTARLTDPRDDLMHDDSAFVWQTPGTDGAFTQRTGISPGKTEYGRAGSISYCHIRSPAHAVSRSAPTAVDRRWLKMVLQVVGECRMVQGKKQVDLRPGTWTIYDAGRDFSIVNYDYVEQVVLLLPRDRVLSGSSDASSFELVARGQGGGIEAVVRDLLLSVIANPSVDSDVTSTELGDSISALVRACLLQRSEKAGRASWYTLSRERILTFIAFNLSRADLSLDLIADEFGYSKRQIHRIFRDHGTTCANFIRDARLDRCKADLLDRRDNGRSITDIALGWGFSSSAYFASAFKMRFGISPREMRAMSASL